MYIGGTEAATKAPESSHFLPPPPSEGDAPLNFSPQLKPSLGCRPFTLPVAGDSFGREMIELAPHTTLGYFGRSPPAAAHFMQVSPLSPASKTTHKRDHSSYKTRSALLRGRVTPCSCCESLLDGESAQQLPAIRD